MSTIRPAPEDLEQARRGTDWARIDAMTDEERTANARADPDNPPLSEVGAIRRKLQMSQSEFSVLFRIPLRTLQQWEQERSTPDATAMAYLSVIDRAPTPILKALLADANVSVHPSGEVAVEWREGMPVSTFRPDAVDRLASRLERLDVAEFARKLRGAAQEAAGA